MQHPPQGTIVCSFVETTKSVENWPHNRLAQDCRVGAHDPSLRNPTSATTKVPSLSGSGPWVGSGEHEDPLTSSDRQKET